MIGLGIDSRILRYTWTVFFFFAIIIFLYLAAHTIIVFTLAIFFAHLLAPIANRVNRWAPRRLSRNASLAIVYLILVSLLAAVLIPVGTKVGQQAAALAGRLPSLIQPGNPDQDPLRHFPLPTWLEAQRADMILYLRDRLTTLDATAGPLLSNIGTGIVSGVGNLLSLILIPILSFFFLKDGPDIANSLVAMFPPGRRQTVENIVNDLSILVRQYIGALVILCTVVLVVYAAALSAFGVQFAILLATVAAILELIPVVGPAVGSVVVLLVAALNGFPHLAWIVIFLIVFRLVQDYLISPHLLSSGVEVHPLLVLFGVLAGEQVAGIPGMFFSVPLIAALRIVVRRLLQPAPEVHV